MGKPIFLNGRIIVLQTGPNVQDLKLIVVLMDGHLVVDKLPVRIGVCKILRGLVLVLRSAVQLDLLLHLWELRLRGPFFLLPPGTIWSE